MSRPAVAIVFPASALDAAMQIEPAWARWCEDVTFAVSGGEAGGDALADLQGNITVDSLTIGSGTLDAPKTVSLSAFAAQLNASGVMQSEAQLPAITRDQLSANAEAIGALQVSVSALSGNVTQNANDAATNAGAITALDGRVTALEGSGGGAGGGFSQSYQGANGAATVDGVAEALVSLSGASSAAVGLIPANARVFAVSTRVVGATGGPSFDVGVAGDAQRYAAALSGAAGETHVGHAAHSYPSATDVVLTALGAPFSTGSVRVAVHYQRFSPPTA